jgi:hypothetical protein
VRAVKIRQLPAKWESRHPPIRQHRLLSTSNADPRRNDRARLGGVLIGIFASYFTTRMTINAQQQQIVAQYRRDKRQDIYANVLTQLSGVKTAYNNIVSDIAMDSFAFSFLQGTSAQPVTAPHDAPDLAKNMARSGTRHGMNSMPHSLVPSCSAHATSSKLPKR